MRGTVILVTQILRYNSIALIPSLKLLPLYLNLHVWQILVSEDEHYALDHPGSVHAGSSSYVRPRVVWLDRRSHRQINVTYCNGRYALGWTEKIPWRRIWKTGMPRIFTHSRTSTGIYMAASEANINARHATKHQTTTVNASNCIMLAFTDQKWWQSKRLSREQVW